MNGSNHKLKWKILEFFLASFNFPFVNMLARKLCCNTNTKAVNFFCNQHTHTVHTNYSPNIYSKSLIREHHRLAANVIGRFWHLFTRRSPMPSYKIKYLSCKAEIKLLETWLVVGAACGLSDFGCRQAADAINNYGCLIFQRHAVGMMLISV